MRDSFILLLVIVILVQCKSDIIHCPDYRPLRMKESNPFRSKNKPSLSTSNKQIHPTYSVRDRRQADDEARKTVTIEEWDCPRPGSQRNKKIVKENIRRMERKMKEENKRRVPLDSVSASALDRDKSE